MILVGYRGVSYDMNANAFRHFYDYHFTENRKIWDGYVAPLSPEQFTQDVDYSHGSVRNQIVHSMSTDAAWFSGLRGVEFPEPFNPTDFDDRKIIRTQLLRVLNDLGVKTEYQDYIFYIYSHP